MRSSSADTSATSPPRRTSLPTRPARHRVRTVRCPPWPTPSVPTGRRRECYARRVARGNRLLRRTPSSRACSSIMMIQLLTSRRIHRTDIIAEAITAVDRLSNANDKGRRGRVVPAIRSRSPDLRMPSPGALIGTRCYRSRRELVCRSVTRRVRSPRTPRERIHNLGSARSRAGGVFKGPLGQPAPGRTERSGPSDRPPESRQGSRAVQRALGECLVGLRGHPSSGSSRKVSTPWSWQLNS